ncbi:MAG: hypothetical protein GC162_10650 [Planctomycetes bacterium]|nr:hypothetical protein [Planctomycetota bacterium]
MSDDLDDLQVAAAEDELRLGQPRKQKTARKKKLARLALTARSPLIMGFLSAGLIVMLALAQGKLIEAAVYLMLGLVFCGLYRWSRQKGKLLSAVLTAVGVYVGGVVALAVDDFQSAIEPTLSKAIALAWICVAVTAAVQHRKLSQSGAAGEK